MNEAGLIIDFEKSRSLYHYWTKVESVEMTLIRDLSLNQSNFDNDIGGYTYHPSVDSCLFLNMPALTPEGSVITLTRMYNFGGIRSALIEKIKANDFRGVLSSNIFSVRIQDPSKKVIGSSDTGLPAYAVCESRFRNNWYGSQAVEKGSQSMKEVFSDVRVLMGSVKL